MFDFKSFHRRYPFVGLLLAALFGILVGEYASCSVAVFFFVGVGAALLVLLRKKDRISLFLFVAASFAILHQWQWQQSPALKVASFLNNNLSNIAVEGVVSSEVKLSKSGTASFFVNTKKLTLDGKELNVAVPMFVKWEGPVPAYGDLLRFQAEATKPSLPRNPGEFDFFSWLARQGVYTLLKVDPSHPGEILSSEHGFFFMQWALACRYDAQQLLQLGIETEPQIVDIIEGIALGKKENSNQFPNDDFRLTGTLHLFAISGLHVGMIAMMIWFFLKLLRLPRRVAVLTTIPLLFFYVFMTGLHIGSFRAAIMASIVLLGFLFHRRPQVINSLAAAAFLLLLINTNLLFSIGWQFSFSVVFAILVLSTPLQEWLCHYQQPDPLLPKKLITPRQQLYYDAFYHLSQLVAVSTAAWIGSLLPCLVYFHYLSFSAIFTNLLAVPLAFVILATALVTLLCGVFSTTAAMILNNANWFFAKILLIVVHAFAVLPASSFYVAWPLPAYPRLTIVDLPQAEAALLETHGKTWILNTCRAYNTTRTIVPLLTLTGVNKISGAIITENNSAHAGGLSLLEKLYPTFPVWMLVPKNHTAREKEKTVSLSKVHPLHEGEKIIFSSTCWGEVLFSSADQEQSSDGRSNHQRDHFVLLKLHLGKNKLLLLPKAFPTTIESLLKQKSSDELKADILEIPLEDLSRSNLEEQFLATVAPKNIIVPSNPHNEMLIEEMKPLFDKYGIKLFWQDQTGAVIIEAKPEGVEVRGFLKN